MEVPDTFSFRKEVVGRREADNLASRIVYNMSYSIVLFQPGNDTLERIVVTNIDLIVDDMIS